MSVVKAIPKGLLLVTANRCPKCKNTSKFTLNLNKKTEWVKDIGESFLTCDLCGTSNRDNIVGQTFYATEFSPSMYRGGTMTESKKIMFQCKQCGQKRMKVTTGDLWRDIESSIGLAPQKVVEAPKPAAPVDLRCPKCESPVSSTDKICKKCGIELICDKCQMPIAPGARFCASCGDRVEYFDVSSKATTVSNVCPSCNDPITSDQMFCVRCGQELKCDKCGARLGTENAKFCRECGDPIKGGEL